MDRESDGDPCSEDGAARARTEEDEDRDAILARRALFIASAVAGIGLASCDGPGPFACLEPPPVDAGTRGSTTTTAPTPCLTVATPEPPPPDAGATIDGPDAAARRDGGPAPQPCLTRLK